MMGVIDIARVGVFAGGEGVGRLPAIERGARRAPGKGSGELQLAGLAVFFDLGDAHRQSPSRRSASRLTVLAGDGDQLHGLEQTEARRSESMKSYFFAMWTERRRRWFATRDGDQRVADEVIERFASGCLP
jgi:hypothetical protein